MFYMVMKKELLNNLLNKRFLLLLILSLSIAWSSTFVLTNQYNEHVKEYYNQVNLQKEMLDDHFNLQAWDGALMMPPQKPSTLSSLVESVKNIFPIFTSLDLNPFPILFPFMDIVFIIGIILSVASLTLSYDSISGEKEIGTLKLLFNNPLSRAEVLIGKWLGGFLSVLIILLVTLIGTVLIASMLSQSIWAAPEWITIFSLFVLSVLYCAAFYSIGFYVSAKTHKASDSIIIALLFWLIFTLVIPTIPRYIAEIVYPTPSTSKIQYEVFFTLKQEEINSLNKIREPFIKKGFTPSDVEKITKPETEKIISDYENKADQLKQSAMRGSAIYEAITALLQFLSPYSSYVIAGSELTATGAANQINFANEEDLYVKELQKYINKKADIVKLGNKDFNDTTYIDIRNRPRFRYTALSISARLLSATTHTVFIFIYVILFFLLAWKAFLKYDVR